MRQHVEACKSFLLRKRCNKGCMVFWPIHCSGCQAPGLLSYQYSQQALPQGSGHHSPDPSLPPAGSLAAIGPAGTQRTPCRPREVHACASTSRGLPFSRHPLLSPPPAPCCGHRESQLNSSVSSVRMKQSRRTLPALRPGSLALSRFAASGHMICYAGS